MGSALFLGYGEWPGSQQVPRRGGLLPVPPADASMKRGQERVCRPTWGAELLQEPRGVQLGLWHESGYLLTTHLLPPAPAGLREALLELTAGLPWCAECS